MVYMEKEMRDFNSMHSKQALTQSEQGRYNEVSIEGSISYNE